MGFLPNPWLILGMMLALAGVYGYAHHQGYKEKETEDAIVIAKKDQRMNDAKEKSDAELHKAQADLTSLQKKRSADIASGNQRLFVKLATPSANAASADGCPAPTAQLDPEFAQSLVAITDDGDAAIRKLNACLAVYETVRKMINGTPATH